jgi:hypothetical protein
LIPVFYSQGTQAWRRHKSQPDLRVAYTGAPQDLLAEVQQGGSGADHLALAGVLVNAAKSGDDAIRATALRWLAAFVADAKPALLPLYAQILQAILPALSAQHPDILQARALLFHAKL